ncbi:MAG: hypothetical protein ABI954_14530 [Pyrinomonadaceae bacterium]
MVKTLFTILATIFLCAVSVSAQSYRITELANRLSTQSEDLAERSYNAFTARSSNNRTDLDNLMLAEQLSASANTFRRMVQDRRREPELRDAAAILMDLSRRFPSYGDTNSYWRDSQRSIDDINRELQVGSGNSGNPTENRDILGQVRWRGTVDDEVQLYISDSNIDARTISGTAFPNGNYNFTSPLPDSRRITVGVNKLKGRGNVRVIQQPTKDNSYTAVVQIKDSGSGAKEYELEIYWTR